jgi:hypothetical protein
VLLDGRPVDDVLADLRARGIGVPVDVVHKTVARLVAAGAVRPAGDDR